MANYCINHSDYEYLALKEMTGLCEAELDALIRPYLEETGEFPSVDMFLNDVSTEEHLVKKYNLKKKGKSDYYLSDNDIDLVELNKIYRDLEVSSKKMKNGQTKVWIKKRALPKRNLQKPFKKILPTVKETTSEVPPVWSDGVFYVYNLLGLYYKTDLRISNANLLVSYSSFNTLEEAINSPFLSNTTTNYDTIYAIINSKALEVGQEIKIQSELRLPPKIRILNNFLYPKFIINDNINDYEVIDGVININSSLVNSNLEETLLKALGYDDPLIIEEITTLRDIDEYDVIYIGNNSYAITKNNNSNLKDANLEDIIRASKNNIEAILDRLELYYGIKFHRVTTEQLKSNEFSPYISNASTTNAFILNGEIYINTDICKSDAPIHELSHIVIGSIRLTNPLLYALLVNSVEQLEDYKLRLLRYPNRTRMDVNEEIFVDLFANNFIREAELNIDKSLLKKSEYEIKRNIDSAIFPYTSTTNTPLSNLMLKSFDEIMTIFGTTLERENFIRVYNKNLGVLTRYTANIKERLLRNGDLKEYCE